MPKKRPHHYKALAPKLNDKGLWDCTAPDCGRMFGSESGAWGHVGKIHSFANQPFQHGTVAGYLKHRRRNKPACPGCKAAWRVYYQMQRAKKKGLI